MNGHELAKTQKYLAESPILKYPDPEEPYTLFTDASKHAWACVFNAGP